MTTPDVPAERGRDELREKLRHLTRDSGPLGSAVCALLNAAEADLPVMVMPYESRAILDLLAQREAPTEGISLSAQLSQAAAWMRVWDECQRLGMDTYGAPITRTGLDIVLDFIRGHAAPQEAREPDGWAIRMRDGSWRSTVYEDPETAERKAVKAREFFAARGDEDDEFDSIDVLPVYLGAPAKATACPCGGGPGHGDAWCGDYECPTCGRGPKQEEAIFQAGVERGRAAPAPAEATEREPELLGYVVERQLTTGEWMRVWRGSTMWIDHDEAVLDRDAYALDGIRAHIRPVYLGAPAPASGEPSGADAAVREAPPISDTAVARIIEAVEAHCGMGRGAWDMVAARDLVEGFAAALGADARRIDALDN